MVKAAKIIGFAFLLVFINNSCRDASKGQEEQKSAKEHIPPLDYTGTPEKPGDTSLLSFSDQGAWFSFSIPDDPVQGGFSGPFLMTQDNGIWASKNLVGLQLFKEDQERIDGWKKTVIEEDSPLAKIGLSYKNESFEIFQTLFYPSSRSAAVKITIKNNSSEKQGFYPSFSGELMDESLSLQQTDELIQILSSKEDAIGFLRLPEGKLALTETSYQSTLQKVELEAGDEYHLIYTLSFLFPEDDTETEKEDSDYVKNNFDQVFQERKEKKEAFISSLEKQLPETWQDSEYRQLMLKTVLTLQNNWRSAAGNLNYDGLFPSYHSRWFQGFWAWDSWKHAVALATFDTKLAKAQVLTMYDYMDSDGFIPDDIFRNNRYEENNYRDTKPPLSAWAVWEIYRMDADQSFLKEIYPKLVQQHKWWYNNRDHDQNGLCEYGSTDGTLVAAKWESGMDNAVRFDESEILKNNEKAYSLNQESVDLNSYLYAEKIFLSEIAATLGHAEEGEAFRQDAEELKERIQTEFYDEETGWFYDRIIETGELIKVKGPEGWIPLWAKAATEEQAETLLKGILDPELFNTKVPFPTLNADHEKFQPEDGYWRGPVWLDQAYFGIKGLKNYGFQKEADELTFKLFHNAEGVLNSGRSIRENYNPMTGKGLESQNFSWSAAHYLLLLLNK